MKYLTLIDTDGERHHLPAVVQLCSTCDGHGTVDNPAFDQGFTRSEWAELDCDEQDAYMSGAYDVQCSACHGQRTQLVPDVSMMTWAQRRMLVRNRRAERFDAEIRRQIQGEIDAERRLGIF